MEKPVMVVGTTSPQRRALAARHFGDVYTLVYVSPDIDEKQVRGDDAATLTRRVAEAKMAAVLARLDHDDDDAAVALPPRTGARRDVVVTFDQVVVWHGHIREKPTSVDENVRFLRDYSGSAVHTVQTTVLHRLDTHAQGSKVNTTTVHYRAFDDDDDDGDALPLPERVVARGASLRAAGGLLVEDADLMAHMTHIEPADGLEEVQGFSARAIRALLDEV